MPIGYVSFAIILPLKIICINIACILSLELERRPIDGCPASRVRVQQVGCRERVEAGIPDLWLSSTLKLNAPKAPQGLGKWLMEASSPEVPTEDGKGVGSWAPFV